MNILKWLLIGGSMLLVGCTPKLDDGVTPNQASYTNTGFPNPLVLFDGYLAAGSSLNVYEYSPSSQTDATALVQPDTTMAPTSGPANLMDALTNYNQTTWVGFPILSAGPITLTSGNYSEITFYVKASFAAAVAPALPVTEGVISFSGLGIAMTPITVTTNWQKVSLPVAGVLEGPAATVLFMANFYAPGSGNPTVISAPVTAYLDAIQLQ